jgi:hypothetical protein
VEEFCDGAGSCPADAFEPGGTFCGNPGDNLCDLQDTCDGSGTCDDNVEPTTKSCRADAGECDVEEVCDGAGSCPADAFEPSGTFCGSPGDNLCDLQDTCDGSGVCQDNSIPGCFPTETELSVEVDTTCPALMGDGCGDLAGTEVAIFGLLSVFPADTAVIPDTCDTSGGVPGSCRATMIECSFDEECPPTGVFAGEFPAGQLLTVDLIGDGSEDAVTALGSVDAQFVVTGECIELSEPGDPLVEKCPIQLTGGSCSIPASSDTLGSFTLECVEGEGGTFSGTTGDVYLVDGAATFISFDFADVATTLLVPDDTCAATCTSNGGGDACLGTLTECVPATITLDGVQVCDVISSGNTEGGECVIDGFGPVTLVEYGGGLDIAGTIVSSGSTLTYAAQVDPAPQMLTFEINDVLVESALDVTGTLDATLTVDVAGCAPTPEGLACPISGTGVQCTFQGSTSTLMGWTLTCDQASSSLTGTVILDPDTFEAIDLKDVAWDIALELSLDDKGCTFDCTSTGTGDACVGLGAQCVDLDVDLDASIAGQCIDDNGGVVLDDISGFLWTEAASSIRILPTASGLSVDFEGGFKDDDNDGAANEPVEFSVNGGQTFLEPIDATTSFFTGSYDLTPAPTCTIDYTAFEAVVDGWDEFSFSSNTVPEGTQWQYVAPDPPEALPTATCTLTGEFGQPGSRLDVRTVADGLLQLINPDGSVLCSVPGTTVIDTASRPEKSLVKELVEGPLEVGICLLEATVFEILITYTGPDAVVVDHIPAEFTVVECNASAGVYRLKRGRGRNPATRITWTEMGAGTNTLECTIETAGSPGGCSSGEGFRPTSCGPLIINEGATATGTEIDPKTGLEEPFTLETGPLSIEAVAGEQPCED